ncbi:MAG: YCF48-related protein [Desulfuromonadales bacterium]
MPSRLLKSIIAKLPTLLACAGLTLVLLLPAQPGLASESLIMPLAEQSLLLDGQAIGDRIVVVGERGHILTSEDQGQSWQQQPVPTRATLTSVFFIDPANGWAAGHDSVILRTQDGGRHWQEVYADPADERPILDLWFKDADQGYAIGAYGLFLATDDGGTSWQPVDFEPATMVDADGNGDDPWAAAEAEVWVDYHLNQIAATDNGRVYIAAEAGNIYRSDDGCRSWLSLPSPYEGSFYGSLPLGPKTLLLFGLRGHLFRSENAGATWTEIPTATQATLNNGIRLQDGRIALAGLAGTLLISADNGFSFTAYPQKNRAGIARVVQASDGALVLIGEAGVRRIALPEAKSGEAP